MGSKSTATLEIRSLRDQTEAEVCARMMASSEPWITLRRDYEAALKILIEPEREVYLAVHAGEVVGFTILVLRGAFVGYIQSICVAAEWRGKGVGSRLLAYAEARIFNETPNVFLCVSSFNQGARRLYERLGYEVVGELKDYVVAGHSEFLLRKFLAPLSEFNKNNKS